MTTKAKAAAVDEGPFCVGDAAIMQYGRTAAMSCSRRLGQVAEKTSLSELTARGMLDSERGKAGQAYAESTRFWVS